MLVLGSNKPATETPSLFLRFLTISILVSPNLRSKVCAIWDIRLLGDVTARRPKAVRRSPPDNADRTKGCTGMSRPITASAAR